MRTRRLVVLSALLLAACGSPSAGPPGASPEPTAGSTAPRAARKPTVLVAAGERGLVRVDVGGSLRPTMLLQRHEGSLWPTHVEGSRVAYAVRTEGASSAQYVDVGWLDPATREHRMLTRGGETAQVLNSPDGKHRYVVHSADMAVPTSVYRTDADGGNRTTLLDRDSGTWLTRAALSPDGRTLYVAGNAEEKPFTVFAIDTATGERRVIEHRTPFGVVSALAASPDGRTLALTVGNWDPPETGPEVHVALVPTGGGEPRLLESAADLHADGFSRDGGHLVLTMGVTTELPDDRDETRYSLGLADVATGRVERIEGTDGLKAAVSLD